MEGVYQVTQTNLWSAVPSQGPQPQLGGPAHSTIRETVAPGVTWGSLDGMAGVLEASMQCNNASTSYSTLPSGLFAALDELATAIGIMPGLSDPAGNPNPPGAGVHLSAAPHHEPSGPASQYTSVLTTEHRLNSVSGILPNPFTAPGASSPAAGYGPTSDQVMGMQGPQSQSLPHIHLQPLGQVPTLTATSAEQAVVGSLSALGGVGGPRPEVASRSVTQFPLYALPSQAKQLDGSTAPNQQQVEHFLEQQQLNPDCLEVATGALPAVIAALSLPSLSTEAQAPEVVLEPTILVSEELSAAVAAAAAAAAAAQASAVEAQHCPQSQTQPQPQLGIEHVQSKAPLSTLAPQQFKAPTIAMLRAMRNSAASAAAATAAAAATPVPTTAPATATPPPTASSPGAYEPVPTAQCVAEALPTTTGPNILPLSGEPHSSLGEFTVGSTAAAVADCSSIGTVQGMPSPSDSCDGRGQPGDLNLTHGPSVQAPPSGVRDSLSDAPGPFVGAATAATATAGWWDSASGDAPVGSQGQGQPLAGAAAEGLPSLLSADPEELVAAIAAAVAAVAAATRATTEAAEQASPTDQQQQPSQPQLQAGQHLLHQQPVLLPAVAMGGDLHLQQQQQQQPQPAQYPSQPQLLQQPQQQMMFAPVPASLQLNIQQHPHPQSQQQHHHQVQPQQAQHLQLQFVPNGHGGGMLQVFSYGGNTGAAGGGVATLPLVSEALPPAAAALLGTALPPGAAVPVAGQAHVPVQQMQYSDVVQMAWPGPSGHLPAAVVYNPSGGYQQQHPAGHQPQVQDVYGPHSRDDHYHYAASESHPPQLQEAYMSYEYDILNPPQQQLPPQSQYGSAPDAPDKPEVPRHPTPYIYRPAPSDSYRDPPVTDSLYSARPSGDPRPGYVPLRHRAPSAPEPEGWRSLGRRTGYKQHPQHLLWSPPPSVLYTPTRDYESPSESPPMEVIGDAGGVDVEAPAVPAAGDAAVAEGDALGGTGVDMRAGAISHGVDECASAGAPAPQRGPSSATTAAIQLIEARRKQAQSKEQLAKEQKVKEQQKAKEQQTKEQQQSEEQEPKSQHFKWPKVREQQATEGQTKPPPQQQQTQLVAKLDQQEQEEQASSPERQQRQSEPPDLKEQGPEEQPEAETAQAEGAPLLRPQRPGRVANTRGTQQPSTSRVPFALAIAASDALEPKPLGRSKEQARAELDAATQAMLEKARRLRQQLLQERIEHELQRKEQAKLRRQQEEQEEERLRERLRERLSQQQKAKASGTAVGAGVPVLSKPRGSVAAALAARLAASGKNITTLAGAGTGTTAVAVAGGSGVAGGAVTEAGSGVADGTTAGDVGGHGTFSEVELQDLEADLEVLEQQIASAPSYGMNARALVLRAAELVAKREAARPAAAAGGGVAAASRPTTPAASDPAVGLISVVKPLADAVPVSERTFVTYVPRSSIPRLVRQEAAHSLTGSYLAVALQRASVPEARAVQAVTSEPELRKSAVEAAGQHEMAIYRQVTSKMNYELLFRKTKAEPERLKLSNELVQLLNKKYGNGSGAKSKPTAGGAAAGRTAAAKSPTVAVASAGVSGGNGGRSVMPGTKQQLTSKDELSGFMAAAPQTKRPAKPPVAAAAAAAAGSARITKATVGREAAKGARAVEGRAEGSLAGSSGGSEKTAEPAVDKLFADSDSENEKVSRRPRTGRSSAEAKEASPSGHTDVEADRHDEVAVAAIAAASPARDGVAVAAAAGSGGGHDGSDGGTGEAGTAGGGNDMDMDGDGTPDAPYEDLFGSDTESGHDGDNTKRTEEASVNEAAPKPTLQSAPVSQAPDAAAQATALLGPSDGPMTAGSATAARQRPLSKPRAASAVTVPAAYATADGGRMSPATAVPGTETGSNGTGHSGDTKRRRVGEAGGTKSGGATADSHHHRRKGERGFGQEIGPSHQGHVHRKKRRSRSQDPAGNDACVLESNGSGGCARQDSLPLQGHGSASGSRAKDGRQGPGPVSQPPQQQQQRQVPVGPTPRGGMSQEEWEQTEARQKLRQQVLAFIHATLEPLFRAGLLGKEPYKRVAAKTSERLMSAHPDDISADFLVREHSQVSRFIMKVVEREQQRDGEQQQQQDQEQDQKQK